MKRLLNKAIVLAMMAATWMGCSQDEVIVDCDVKINSAQESESDIPVSLNLSIPDPIQVTSRDVTETVGDFTVLCFDKNGNALTKLPATDKAGTLTVKIPNATRAMHVFANQDSIPFVKGMSEDDERLTNLAATADKMVYWGRIEVPTDTTSTADVKKWWANPRNIRLLRNQAKVEVANKNSKEFTLLGYTVVNTYTTGMAIPYYAAAEGAYPTNAVKDFTPAFSLDDWKATKYVHVPANAEQVTDKTLHTKGAIYVYETSAESEKPASIIIYGYNNAEPDNKKYWRVEFADANRVKYDIRRNHCYKLSIEGHILNGYAAFDDALNGDPVGIKVDVAEEVTAIKNSEFSMTVENTSYVLADDKDSLNFNFTIAQLGDSLFSVADLKVDWESGQTQTVSSDEHVIYQLTETVVDGKTICTGAVKVNLKKLAAGAERQEGTIVINYAERLERKVKVIVIPQQKFNIVSYNKVTASVTDVNDPVYEDGALVYKVSVNKADYEKDEYTIDGAPVDSLIFTLPKSFPEQLLPLNVLVSTTDFNVVNSPLIFEGAGGYGDKTIGPGYKYVCPVRTAVSDSIPVQHMIELRYINNVLTDRVELTLEAENFKPVKLIIYYTLEKAESSNPENKDDASENGGNVPENGGNTPEEGGNSESEGGDPENEGGSEA